MKRCEYQRKRERNRDRASVELTNWNITNLYTMKVRKYFIHSCLARDIFNIGKFCFVCCLS